MKVRATIDFEIDDHDDVDDWSVLLNDFSLSVRPMFTK